MMPTITTDIGPWPKDCSVHLALDPVRARVYSWWNHGGCSAPAVVWHGEHVSIASVPTDAVPGPLAPFIRSELAEVLAKIIETHASGNRDKLNELALNVAECISEKYAFNELPRYWDAADYYQEAPEQLSNLARDIGSEAAIEQEIANAQQQGVWLLSDDVEAYLEELLSADDEQSCCISEELS